MYPYAGRVVFFEKIGQPLLHLFEASTAYSTVYSTVQQIINRTIYLILYGILYSIVKSEKILYAGRKFLLRD